MGLEGFLVELDRPDNVYYSGSVINGKVKFRLDKSRSVRGIRIEATGDAETSWERREEKKHDCEHEHERQHERQQSTRTSYETIYFRGYENVFYQKFYILGGSNDKKQLNRGSHEYPFSITLGYNIPSSYDGVCGRISYRVKAILDRPWKFDNEATRSFRVIQVNDLNSNPDALMELRREDEKTFCCMCCKSGPLIVQFSVPYSGYVPGQAIPVDIRVKNTSRVRIKSMDVSLEEDTQYVAESPRYDRKYSSTTRANQSLAGVRPFTSKSYNSTLTVPDDQQPGISNCSLITVSHRLVVSAYVGMMHRNFHVGTPVYIGTVPVKQPPSAFSSPSNYTFARSNWS